MLASQYRLPSSTQRQLANPHYHREDPHPVFGLNAAKKLTLRNFTECQTPGEPKFLMTKSLFHRIPRRRSLAITLLGVAGLAAAQVALQTSM
jgi:hypothetical protein